MHSAPHGVKRTVRRRGVTAGGGTKYASADATRAGSPYVRAISASRSMRSSCEYASARARTPRLRICIAATTARSTIAAAVERSGRAKGATRGSLRQGRLHRRVGAGAAQRLAQQRLARLHLVPRRGAARMGQGDDVELAAVPAHAARRAHDVRERRLLAEHLLDRQRADG